MVVKNLNYATLDYYKKRVQELAANARPQWGKMSPAEMFAHVRRGIEISLGEVEVEDRSTPVLRHFLRLLFFHILPWPKGKIKAPGIFFPKEQAEVEEERSKLLSALDRFVEKSKEHPNQIGVSPWLGPLKLRSWTRIHGKHMNHHLEQFGV